MRLTELVESIADSRHRCGVCQWRCELAAGETGRCLVRVGDAGGIAVLNDGLISAAQVAPIEDHRLWHMLPGTKVLALGGWHSCSQTLITNHPAISRCAVCRRSRS